MTEAKSERRFHTEPSYGPIIQLIIATLPLAVLMGWFVYEAYDRPSRDCSTNPEYVNDDQTSEQIADECSHLIALRDMIIVCLFIALAWSILAVYLSYFIPRRQALVREYLTQGTTIIGDIFYTPRKKIPYCGFLTSYGSVVYSHPNKKTPIVLQRQVRVFERYTREHAGIIYLPDQPCSGQPKADLLIDRDVAEMNRDRLQIMKEIAIFWVIFSLACPLYILIVLEQMDTSEESGLYWQPDYGEQYTYIIYIVFVVFIIPSVSMFLNMVAWKRHHKWMTSTHKILQEGDPINPSGGCCFEDDYEYDDPDYRAPSPVKSYEFQRMEDRGQTA